MAGRQSGKRGGMKVVSQTNFSSLACEQASNFNLFNIVYFISSVICLILFGSFMGLAYWNGDNMIEKKKSV